MVLIFRTDINKWKTITTYVGEMKQIKYAVVILNYRTADDAILAAKSVVEQATALNYRICIIDGGSNSNTDTQILSKCDVLNTDVLLLEENKGYAGGNNEGISYLISKYDIEYIVVMNPDVLLIENDTIEDIIKYVETDSELVGGQPLVINEWDKTPANEQINIRYVFDYFDCIIESFFLLKKIFAKRYKRNVYLDRIPYKQPIKYYVPSGAFFILKRTVFEGIGLFDEQTFLFNEELILGHKLKNLEKKMILIPDHKVMHESGKSTGSSAKRITRFAFKEDQKSLNVYMRCYLKVGFIKSNIVHFLANINYILKLMKYFFTK